MSLPAAYLSQNFTQPRGKPSPHMLALPLARGELCQRWRQDTKLILDQADVAAVSHQVHLALFYDAQLDIKAMPQLKSHRVFAQIFLPARWMRGSSPRMTNVERQPGRQVLALLVPGGRGDKGQPGTDQADTRRLGRVLDEELHISNRVREVLGLACARPNLRLQTGGSCFGATAARVMPSPRAGQKEPPAGGSILPRGLFPSREPLGGHSLSKLSSIEEAVTRSLDRQACTHDVALGAQVLVPSGRGIATRV